MDRFAATTDLLDEGLRLYRRNAGALLRFALGPALAMTLIITALVWYLSARGSGSFGWIVTLGSMLFCFPLLVFLALGVLHGVAADEPLRARRMARGALHRLGQRFLLALAAILPAQILGTLVGGGITQMAVQIIAMMKRLLRVDRDLPWLFVQFCIDGLSIVEQFVVFILGALSFLLPCAAVFYLLQHRIRRLPRPPQASFGTLARSLWQTTAGALLIGSLAFSTLNALTVALRITPLSNAAFAAVLFALVLSWVWLLSLPLPIWMALLYRRNREPALGEDLDRRVQAWSHPHEQRAVGHPLLAEG